MNIQQLPEELLLTLLLEYLHFQDLKELELVSTFFNSLIFDKELFNNHAHMEMPISLSNFNIHIIIISLINCLQRINRDRKK